MKKLLLPILFLLPFTVSAQLDRVKSGMSLDDFRNAFPAAVPDLSAMTTQVYDADTLAGQIGRSEYTFTRDTLARFSFQSGLVPGPCADFPKADNSEFVRMMVSVRDLFHHYSDIFGTPAEQHERPPLQNDASNVFDAKWKINGGGVSIAVRRMVTDAHEMNAPKKKKKETSCSYYVEINAEGKADRLRIEFETGLTKAQFITLHPALSGQIMSLPDAWMLDDPKHPHETWHFWFYKKQLGLYYMESYDGQSYFHSTDSSYVLLRDRATQLAMEAEKQFGKPDSASATVAPVYEAPKSTQLYYTRVDYEAAWKPKNGELYIKLEEWGGGKEGAPVFHLIAYYSDKAK